MKTYFGLIIGDRIHYRHLNKIAKKFQSYYETASQARKEAFFEIQLVCHDYYLLDPPQYFMDCIYIEEEYLPRYIEILDNLGVQFVLCQYQHGHATTTINGIEYSAITYYSVDNVTYLFFEYEDDLIRTDSTFAKKLLTLPLDKQFVSAPRLTSPDYRTTLLEDWVKEILAIE